MIHVSALVSSLTQSSFVRTRLAKKSAMPLVEFANHWVAREKILPKKLSENDSDSGVVEAVVEAMVSMFKLSSCMALAKTTVMLG